MNVKKGFFRIGILVTIASLIAIAAFLVSEYRRSIESFADVAYSSSGYGEWRVVSQESPYFVCGLSSGFSQRAGLPLATIELNTRCEPKILPIIRLVAYPVILIWVVIPALVSCCVWVKNGFTD